MWLQRPRFLQKIDGLLPGELDVHLVCDNYGTHKSPAIRRWLEPHPRFHCTTPRTSAVAAHRDRGTLARDVACCDPSGDQPVCVDGGHDRVSVAVDDDQRHRTGRGRRTPGAHRRDGGADIACGAVGASTPGVCPSDDAQTREIEHVCPEHQWSGPQHPALDSKYPEFESRQRRAGHPVETH